jgi:type IV pilus assembly protein PilY1
MKYITALFLSMLIGQSLSAQGIPCATPPFVTNIVKPNVLIALDVTGSMRWRAAQTIDEMQGGWTWQGGWWGTYDPNIDYYLDTLEYYGYFHPDSIYEYRSNIWEAIGFDNTRRVFNMSDPDHPIISGNILNWGIMSRIDVAKKVLTGGAGEPANQIDKHTLVGWGDGGTDNHNWFLNGWRWWGGCRTTGWQTPPIRVGGRIYRFDKPNYYSGGTRPNQFYIHIWQGNRWEAYGPYRCRINVAGVAVEEKAGVIREIADRNYDGNWDADAPRFALFFWSTWIWDLPIEFYETDESPNMEPFINEINNIDPAGGTPIGSAVLEAIHYISYTEPHRFFGNPYSHHGRGTKFDPYYEGQGASLREVWCRKSFVILIGDGESNSTHFLNSDGHLPPGPFSRPLCNYDGVSDCGDCSNCPGGGPDDDHAADDYAYYGHITDIRPDLQGYQKIDFYALFSFGQGANLFMEIAKDGAFEDVNGDLVPDPYEYDKDMDGIPDAYYDAISGHQLEDAIRKILYDILSRVSSGTAVSLASGGSKGQGVAAFASFYPRRVWGVTQLSWLGVIRSIWVDKFGLIREETQGNKILNLLNDHVVFFVYDTVLNQTMIHRYRDTTGEGDLEFIKAVPVESLKTIWDGSERLLFTSPDDRNIYTFVDIDGDGKVSGGEYMEFNLSNKGVIGPYLRVSPTFAETLIQYIRGYDYKPNLRDRTVPVINRVWKLGDIIFSNPMIVGEPMERYDFIYGDIEYAQFYNKYKERRTMVYVGANDGMIHVFHAGKYNEIDNDIEILEVDPDGIPLGKEVYAYIPFNLLPHLKWLTDHKYCHVYYVDLKPYPTDVKIFTPDATHKEGWGTIIIGGMRLGGTTCDTNGQTFTSSYFVLDVTDPDKLPELLWERQLPDSSYTTSFPAVVKVDTAWFLIIGSGATNLDGTSDKSPSVYVLDLKTGTILREFPIPETNSLVGDIIGVDYNLKDYSVDYIYFGTARLKNGNPNDPDWGGRVYKITTYNDPDPLNWDLSILFDGDKPVTAAVAASKDPLGRVWVYFGTGRYYNEGDERDRDDQYLVGVRDEGITLTWGDLYDVTDIRVFSEDTVITGVGSIISFYDLQNTVLSHYGWYRKLPRNGERCITSPAVIAGAVFFTTYAPLDDPCKFGGKGFLFALYYLTGTAYAKPLLGEESTGENIAEISTGAGMPAEPTIFIGASEEKVYVQTGTGSIKVIDIEELPYNPRGGVIHWQGR